MPALTGLRHFSSVTAPPPQGPAGRPGTRPASLRRWRYRRGVSSPPLAPRPCGSGTGAGALCPAGSGCGVVSEPGRSLRPESPPGSDSDPLGHAGGLRVSRLGHAAPWPLAPLRADSWSGRSSRRSGPGRRAGLRPGPTGRP